jgi:hypothetical protein
MCRSGKLLIRWCDHGSGIAWIEQTSDHLQKELSVAKKRAEKIRKKRNCLPCKRRQRHDDDVEVASICPTCLVSGGLLFVLTYEYNFRKTLRIGRKIVARYMHVQR